MDELKKGITVGLVIVLAAGAIIGGGITAAAIATARAARVEEPTVTYVPCLEAGMIPPQDQTREPRVLPCPPAGSSARNPVIVDTGSGRIRLAYFDAGRWFDAATPPSPIHAVWSWRWP